MMPFVGGLRWIKCFVCQIAIQLNYNNYKPGYTVDNCTFLWLFSSKILAELKSKIILTEKYKLFSHFWMSINLFLCDLACKLSGYIEAAAHIWSAKTICAMFYKDLASVIYLFPCLKLLKSNAITRINLTLN